MNHHKLEINMIKFSNAIYSEIFFLHFFFPLSMIRWCQFLQEGIIEKYK